MSRLATRALSFPRHYRARKAASVLEQVMFLASVAERDRFVVAERPADNLRSYQLVAIVVGQTLVTQ
jgi:hypothetical protein